MSTVETATLRGPELMRAVINQIIDSPELWDQRAWHCGTKHCVGGWCQVKAGLPETEYAGSVARELLGLSASDANWLFSGTRSLPEIYGFAKAYIEEPDRAGYDRAGYNSAGYDRAGYNRAGYDRAGYNRAGYDRAGYDRAGYDRAGYNSDGYDRAGYDRAGYNSDGYDRAGVKLEMVPL